MNSLIDFLLGLNQNKDRGPNSDEMGYLAQKMREFTPTFSDTSGMGNVQSWQMPHSSFPPSADDEMNLWHALNMAGGGKERMGMEKYANELGLLEFLKSRQELFNKGPRYQVHPAYSFMTRPGMWNPMPYDRMPGIPMNNVNKRM